MSNQSKAGWPDFWKGERQAFFEIMKLSTSVFAERFDAHFGIDKTHSILDFGCGPGFFIDSEIDKRAAISGVDINSFFVDECKRKYPGIPVFQIPTDHSGLEAALRDSFGESRFDFIVLLSVCQYLKDKEQLRKIVGLMTLYLAHGGRIVIADVLTPATSSVRDILALLRICFTTGKLMAMMGFVRYLLFSDYGNISKSEGLRVYIDDDFMEIARLNDLVCSRVDRLTLHPTRTNYVMTKAR